MTLVAAYRPKGIPVLLGDFLITGTGVESTSKKIHKVGPNFVIGWTGKRILAAPILRALFEEFNNREVSIAEVQEFLTNRPSDELNGDELYLVGWVIDDVPHCFLWNIANPNQLFFQPSYIVGSGEKKFQTLLTKTTFGGAWGSTRTTIKEAIYSALAKATELYADENLDKMNRRERFGHGYELLYFDGKEFRYIENIAFFGMDILLNTDDFTGRSAPYEHWYRYHSLGDSSFVQDWNLRTGKMILELISPIFTLQSRDASFEFTAGSFRADYYCIYFRLQTTNGEQFSGSLVLAENNDGPSKYAKEENGTYKFELGRDLIKFIYENIKAELEHHMSETIPWGWGAAETAQKMRGAGSGYQARLAQNDKCVVLGLIQDAPWDKNFATMEYALMACADAKVQIYEKGIAVGPLNEEYRADDTFTISVEKVDSVDTVRFYINSKLVYQSLTAPTFPLRGAVCLHEDGAGFSESKLFGNWVQAAAV
jgi:hypothetical protein